MPKIDAKFDLGFVRWLSGCFADIGFSLVDYELSQCFDSFCSAGISYPSGFVFPFAALGAFVSGVVLGFEHQRRV